MASITEAQSLSKSKRLGIATILGSLSALGPLSIDMYLPAFPQIAEEFNTSASLTQVSLTACLIGLAVGQLVIGPISDVKGRRKPLLIGMLLYAIVSIICMFSTSIWAFIGLRFVQGLAGAAGLVISRASVRDLYSGPELIRFMATLMIINGVAPILAPIIGGEVLNYTSWKGVFGLLSVFGIIMLIGIYYSLGETLPEDRRSRGGLLNTLRTFGSLLKDKSFIGYVLMQGFVMASMFAYISGSSFVLQGIYEMSVREYSIMFGINGLGIVIAGQCAGRLAHKFAPKSMIVTGLSMSGFGSILLLLAVFANLPLAFVVVGLFFVVSSVGLINTTATSLALEKQGERAGSASAMLGTTSFLFGGIVAPIVGLGGEGTAVPMVVTIAIMVSCAWVFYKFSQKYA
ncbi:MAG: multidrug effflux MFS transporter [Candidatus Pristimantibacillus lignocellulolyticus]|uniref:Bcr/CflA family efflux transporter n=1 Tax=Candidatus Pristimantibacillus lignocellulolyticus TaxID=2994561 RepID=A0A9J6ZGG2_9BACL|nr:MAG: multidrug effflux MFS transporter [Candidatus Pristimantibacillus lignocellulolyticus]